MLARPRQAHRAAVTEEQDFEDDSDNAISMDLCTDYLFQQKEAALPTSGALPAISPDPPNVHIHIKKLKLIPGAVNMNVYFNAMG